jgi:hypothetical protein
MADTYVAVSSIQHGEGDDGVTTFERGDEVKGFDDETMVHLWSNGAIAVKGSPEDPNTWPENNVVQNTTPRYIEDVLKAQAAAKGAPSGVDVPMTQPHLDTRPSDPAALLGIGEGVGDGAKFSESLAGPTAITEDEAAANQREAAEAEAKADKPAPKSKPATSTPK